jgi:hypothetical protein
MHSGGFNGIGTARIAVFGVFPYVDAQKPFGNKI